METHLKPCPFCGGEAVRVFNSDHFIRCENWASCGCASMVTSPKKWNTRKKEKETDRAGYYATAWPYGTFELNDCLSTRPADKLVEAVEKYVINYHEQQKDEHGFSVFSQRRIDKIRQALTALRNGAQPSEYIKTPKQPEIVNAPQVVKPSEEGGGK